MDTAILTSRIQQKAIELGFDSVGVCPAVTPSGISNFHRWLDLGYAGEMSYLENRREAYSHPQSVLSGVRSIVVLAMNYKTIEAAPLQVGQGRISRYAWGEVDYHDMIRDKLNILDDYLVSLAPEATCRGVVDTAPLLERDLAQLSGLGWIGKNTLLLNQKLGSLFFLAVLLTDAELEFDGSHETDHCGTCTACLEACPTDAFVQPYVLDSTKCISYLTIEKRTLASQELRKGQEDWLFGCDVCQDVCPWNHKVPQSLHPEFQPTDDANPVNLVELLYLDKSAFRKRFRRTPLWRSKRRGILRNAAIVLGNQAVDIQALGMQSCDEVIAALVHILNDQESIIRAASAWALGNFANNDQIINTLSQQKQKETDRLVLNEINNSLQQIQHKKDTSE